MTRATIIGGIAAIGLAWLAVGGVYTTQRATSGVGLYRVNRITGSVAFCGPSADPAGKPIVTCATE